MRRTLLVGLLAIGLLATPFALADGADRSGKGKAIASERSDRALNATDDDHRSNRSDDDAKPAWVAAFQARLRELRASWLENATAMREECRAAEKPGENATKEERREWAHCIKDAYKAWFDVLRAEKREAKDARHA